MMKKITLEEKIEVIRAFSEGKPVEGCNKEVGLWEDKVYDIWDFDDCKYRIKPEATTKFKSGDVLLAKEDEYQSNPARFEISNIKQGCYCFKDYMDKPINDIDRDYVNERDVLWYFETYDISAKTYAMTFTRKNITEADKEFAPYKNSMKWQPMYSLGFKLKES